MSDETSPSPGSPPPSRWDRRLLGLLIPILGIAYLVYPHLSRYLADPYVVTAGEALYYPGRPWGMQPGPLTLEVDVECNRRQPIPFCEMVVDSISDDAGNDQLSGPLHVTPFGTHPPSPMLSYHGMQDGNSISGVGTSWPASVKLHQFTWRIDVPRLPLPEFKGVRLAGHIGLWEGGEDRQIRVPNVEFKTGTTFQIDGRTAEIVESMEAGKGSSNGTCIVMIPDDGLFVVRAECQSAGSHPEVEQYPRRNAQPKWPDQTSKGVICFNFSTPAGATAGDVTFHYRVNARHLVLPVDLRYPVSPTTDDGPVAEEEMVSRRRPADHDWGTPMPAGRYPVTRAEVTLDDVRLDPEYPETSIDISLHTEGADQPIASDIRIDRLQDAESHDFLARLPWRTSEYLPLTLWTTHEPSAPRYKLNVGTIGKVQGSGVYRLAFGSDEFTVTIPGRITPASRADVGTPIDLGVVRLLPHRLLSDSIEFKVEGNTGLVREITALDADGKALGSDKPGVHAFYSQEDWHYIRMHGKPDEIRQWKVTYFRQSTWLERPFEFSVDSTGAAPQTHD